MPFPKMHVFFSCGFGSVSRSVSLEKDDGSVETKIVPCNQCLPSADKFAISAQIKAGVNLKEVSTNILSGGVDSNLADAVESINVALKNHKQNENSDSQDKE